MKKIITLLTMALLAVFCLSSSIEAVEDDNQENPIALRGGRGGGGRPNIQRSSNLNRANVNRTNLNRTNLNRTNWSNTNLNRTNWSNTNLARTDIYSSLNRNYRQYQRTPALTRAWTAAALTSASAYYYPTTPYYYDSSTSTDYIQNDDDFINPGQ